MRNGLSASNSDRSGSAALLLRIVVVMIVYAVVCAVSLAMGLRYNRFPVGYHPDEASKAEQILSGEYNFYHPLLLLQVTRVFCAVCAEATDGASVVYAGRDVSALFAAGAALCLMLCVHILHDERAAVMVGLSVAFCPMLVTLAHYMKEDTALLFGLGGVFAALAVVERFGGLWPFALAGLAAALTASAKYVGLVGGGLALLLCVRGALVSARCDDEVRWGRVFASLGIFFLVLLFVVGVLHYPAFFRFGSFRAGLTREGLHVAEGHGGVLIRSVPVFLFGVLRREVLWPVWLLAGFEFVRLFCRWRRVSAVERVLVLFPLGWFVLLLPSQIQNVRYLAPAVVWLHVLAGLGIWRLVDSGFRGRRWVGVAGGVAAVVLWGWLAGRCVDYLKQFRDDSRQLLAVWVRDHLREEDVVMQESYVNLPKRIQVRSSTGLAFMPIHDTRFAAAFDSVDTVRRYGITHMILSSLAYERYVDPNRCPTEGIREEFERRRAFYEQLFREGKLVWEASSDTPVPGPTNPTIRIYRIQPSTGEGLRLRRSTSGEAGKWGPSKGVR